MPRNEDELLAFKKGIEPVHAGFGDTVENDLIRNVDRSDALVVADDLLAKRSAQTVSGSKEYEIRERDREILALMFRECCNQGEIAKRLGVHRNTVSARMSEITEHLRETMPDELEKRGADRPELRLIKGGKKVA
jgi:DNA-directed RNA polymerase specialized sigma subunit